LVGLALSDHDTAEGVPAALEAGTRLGIEVLPGVELSVDWDGNSIEVLGYLWQKGNTPLSALLITKHRGRIERAQRIVEKLAELGLPVSWERVLQLAGPGTIGRPHLALAMVEAGYVQTSNQAFDLYLGNSRPANVSAGGTTTLQAGLDAVHASGGVCILAHPVIPGVHDYADIDKLIPAAISAGVDGWEAYYPGYTPELTLRLERLAHEQGLIVTGGSDYHGTTQGPQYHLGEAGVPLRCLLQLKERQLRWRI
jgi:predicted metal-dependent phosphoesterase TrpH